MKMTKNDFTQMVNKLVKEGAVQLDVTFVVSLCDTYLSYIDGNCHRQQIRVCKSADVENRMSQVTRFSKWLKEMDLDAIDVRPQVKLIASRHEAYAEALELLGNIILTLNSSFSVLKLKKPLTVGERRRLLENKVSHLHRCGASADVIAWLEANYPHRDTTDRNSFLMAAVTAMEKLETQLNHDVGIESERLKQMELAMLHIEQLQNTLSGMLSTYAQVEPTNSQHPKVHLLIAQKRVQELKQGINGLRL